MSIFPKIHTLDDMLPFVKDKEYIGVNKQSNGATVICYNISNGECFQNGYEKESRGITFDGNGDIISRPLHKFFNLAERPEVQPHMLDWNTLVGGFNKMDGSMITSGLMNGEIFAKSKKSFESDVAVSSRALMSKKVKYHEFTKHCALAHLTPIFEFTSPNHRIVLRYNEDDMTLLHVRDNFTGEYMMPKELKALAEKFDIPVNPPLFSAGFDLAELLHSLNTVVGIEGYVLQFANGDMVKIKTKWYIGLHHAVTFVRERDIARLVLEEKIDDYIAFISLNEKTADLSKIHYINNTIKSEIEAIDQEVQAMAQNYAGQDVKAIAMDAKGYRYFGFLMRAVRGMSNDYLTYYRQELLCDRWSLDQIDFGDFKGDKEDVG